MTRTHGTGNRIRHAIDDTDGDPLDSTTVSLTTYTAVHSISATQAERIRNRTQPEVIVDNSASQRRGGQMPVRYRTSYEIRCVSFRELETSLWGRAFVGDCADCDFTDSQNSL